MPKIKLLITICFFLLILAVGAVLRWRNHTQVPLPGESTDEYSNSWVGLSLIQLGVPVGRSGLVGYGGSDGRYINVDRIYSTTAGGGPLGINKPWLDHPPLLPLITGGYAYLNGGMVFEDATARLIRKPMLVIGIVNIALVGIFAYLLAGPEVGLLAATLFATSPLVVVTSRMIQAENGVILTWLISLICLFIYQKKNRPIYLWLAALTAGTAISFKVSGVVAWLSGAAILLSAEKKTNSRRFWETALFSVISLSFLALFFVYGAAYSFSTFTIVWQSNSTRPYDIGFGSLFNLLTTTKITVSKYLTEGWLLVGWIASLSIIGAKNKKLFSFLIVPLFSYLIIFLLMGGSAYGWYRLPFMPFLFVASAVILAEGFKAKEKLVPVLLALIPLGVTVHKLGEIYNLMPFSQYWRYGLPLVIAWFLFGRNEKLSRGLYFLIISSAIGANIALAYSLTPEVYLKIN